jgi:hypothetical protein
LLNVYGEKNIYTYYFKNNGVAVDIDFLVISNNEIICVEVTENLTTNDYVKESNYEKKVNKLLNLKFANRKIIIAKKYNSDENFVGFKTGSVEIIPLID